MKILMVASEAVPFAKTGGLGDVTGALCKALAAAGQDVVLVLPYYRAIAQGDFPTETMGLQVSVPVGEKTYTADLLRTTLPGSPVTVWLLDCPALYDRDGLYVTPAGDHPDNAGRFVFLSRAALEAVNATGFSPDVLHCHDWQTALVPVYRDTLYRTDPDVARAAVLLTVHALQYQGLFWHLDMEMTGLDWALFNYRQLEFYGKLNFLKGGLVFADLINTVSCRYAEEVQTEEYGCGLDGTLLERTDRLRGVTNGVDYTAWDPGSDPHLAAEYDEENLSGKAECKRVLQEELGLAATPETPVVGMVSRLADAKGLDLVAGGFASMMSLGVQFVLLGEGDARFARLFNDLAERFPGRAAFSATFDEALAHRIQAGSDLFLMPSRFEPCGLTQLYSMRYGTVPVVRETGGLADTVVDCTPESLAAGAATGFVFGAYTREAMLEALRRACTLYADRPNWQRLMRQGMTRDWSWDASAKAYVGLYEEAVRLRRAGKGGTGKGNGTWNAPSSS